MATNKLPKSGIAIASSILGIISFVIMPIFSDISVLPGIIAIILGIAALLQISKHRFGGKGLAISGIVLGCWVLIFLNISLPGRPRYTDYIYYRNPTWLSNEKIVFVKTINHRKNLYDWISSASDSMQDSIKDEIQICSMNIDGSDEKVIKNIVINYTKPGNMPHWKDKTFDKSADQIAYISTNPEKKIIIFSTKTMYRNEKPIFLMSYDGTKLKKIADTGYKPKLSPDGTRILYEIGRSYVNPKYESIKKDYRSEEFRKALNLKDYYTNEYALWVMDSDGGNKHKLTDNAVSGIWHPDGKKVIYESADMPFERRKNYILDLSTNKTEDFFVQKLTPDDWSPDGSKIICGRSIYDSGGNRLKVANIPNDARFSPDGRKIVGAPVDIKADICIVNADGTGLKTLKVNSKVDR